MISITMKKLVIIFAISSAVLIGCGGGHPSAEEAQSTPTALAETIFYLIQNEKYDALPALIDQDADEDSKKLGELKSAGEEEQNLTRDYFESAAVAGDPVIEGDQATVNIKLGHNGSFEETFVMVKKDEKWYLVSY